MQQNQPHNQQNKQSLGNASEYASHHNEMALGSE
jgi:hypothetical protein